MSVDHGGTVLFVCVHRSLLRVYRSLLRVHRSLLCVYMSRLCVLRSLLSFHRSDLCVQWRHRCRARRNADCPLQHTATHLKLLQLTATYCNTQAQCSKK